MTFPEPMAVKPGDAFMLCSDGLHDLVNDGEIRDVIRASDPREACQRLVKMARERGGYDNITIAVAAVPPVNGAAVGLKATREYEVKQ
jgi:protein phosphatase